MDATHSVQVAEERGEKEEEEEEEDEDEYEGDHNDGDARMALDKYLVKKVLEQEPEMLPCYASASPLSPQPSSALIGSALRSKSGTLTISWSDNRHLLNFSSNMIDDDRVVLEVFLISHGECELNSRPDLISGRRPEAGLTANGKRQARALALFLKSQGVRSNSVYSSPLGRSRSMAISVCPVV